MTKQRAIKKRTAVARTKRVADTQSSLPVVRDSVAPVSLPPTVFVVMGHRGGSHGVIGIYATREAADRELFALVAKGNKHTRDYIFQIDERQIHQ